MTWAIEWDEHARKALNKLDKQIATRIIKYLDNRIIPLKDPKMLGKPLSGDKSGLWRYRVGDYRIICRIEDETLTVLVLHLGHRRAVYNEM